MKKNSITVVLLFIYSIVFSQVGINTPNPKATFDVTAFTTNGSKPEGMIAPRLTGDQIRLADAQYGSDQKGTLIYATSAVSATSTKTANINQEGYYYFDGNIWQKIINGNNPFLNIYNSDGIIAANRTVTMNDKTLNFNSTATTGTSHFRVDGSTFNVDAVNNRVGIGVDAPTGRLHIAAPASGDPLIIGGVQNGAVGTDAILGITSTGAVKKLGTLSSLSIPAPALFRLSTERTNFLNGINPGAAQRVPMVLVKSAIPGLTYNASTSVITFPAGTYQMTFVYEAVHGYAGCNISSYFMDFPSTVSPFVRIHSNAPHVENNLGIHGGSIIYSAQINGGQQLTINMGRGQSGNCTGTGMRLLPNSTHLLIYRIGD